MFAAVPFEGAAAAKPAAADNSALLAALDLAYPAAQMEH